MRKLLRASVRISAIAFAGFGALSFASAASAACGDALPQPASWQGQQGSGGLLHDAALNSFGIHTIVGLWSFKMTPTAGPGDFGYQEWHSDGTELMNSGGRAPATGNFCMGAWAQVGANRYHLNHYAISYDSSGTHNANVNIKEDVTLAPNGMSYTGQFTLDVYDPNSNALLAHQAGQVTAQRITAN
jgi:hypothetical protein